MRDFESFACLYNCVFACLSACMLMFLCASMIVCVFVRVY